MNKPPVSVAGSGSWATAIVKLLTENEIPVHWWIRDKDAAESLREKGVNPKYLRGVHFNKEFLHPNTNLSEIIQSSETLIVAIPAAFLDQAFSNCSADIFANKTLVSAVKGLEPGCHLTITQYFEKIFSIDPDNLAVISGPCHAEEVALDLSAYLTIGSFNETSAKEIAHRLSRPYLRCSTLGDMRGIEYAAVLKNIYAIAAGISGAIGEGDNFRSVLVSAAAREIKIFLDIMEPAERDICHSVYLGDLLVTAYSQHSRNRTLGNMIGHGYSVRSAQLEMNMVAEGYYASKSIKELCKEKSIELPIADAVYRILYEQVAPKIEFGLLKRMLY